LKLVTIVAYFIIGVYTALAVSKVTGFICAVIINKLLAIRAWAYAQD